MLTFGLRSIVSPSNMQQRHSRCTTACPVGLLPRCSGVSHADRCNARERSSGPHGGAQDFRLNRPRQPHPRLSGDPIVKRNTCAAIDRGTSYSYREPATAKFVFNVNSTAVGVSGVFTQTNIEDLAPSGACFMPTLNVALDSP